MNVTLLLAAGVIACCGSPEKARLITTQSSMRILSRYVQEFREACGRLPAEAEGLQALVHKPADWPDGVPWPDFPEVAKVPPDAWGHRYVYLLRPESVGGFGIYSCGEDGVTASGGNDRDDLNTWNMQRPWGKYYASHWRRIGLTPSDAFVVVIAVLAMGTVVQLVRQARSAGASPR